MGGRWELLSVCEPSVRVPVGYTCVRRQSPHIPLTALQLGSRNDSGRAFSGLCRSRHTFCVKLMGPGPWLQGSPGYQETVDTCETAQVYCCGSLWVSFHRAESWRPALTVAGLVRPV